MANVKWSDNVQFIPKDNYSNTDTFVGLSNGNNVKYDLNISIDSSGNIVTPAKITSDTANISSLTGSQLVATDSSKNLISVPFPEPGVTSFNTRIGDVIPVSDDYAVYQVTGAAPLSSPALTGVPTTPTAAPGTSTTQIASTAFVNTAIGGSVTSFNTRTGAVVPEPDDYSVDEVTGAAPLASPVLTGTPIAPTASPGTNTTQLATTAFTTTGLALKADLASPTFTGVPAAPTATVGTNTSQLATTAFVTTAAANLSIKNDVRKSTTNTGLTSQTEILVAVSPFTSVSTASNSGGYYILSITDTTNLRQLIVFFQLTATRYNIGYPNSSAAPLAVPGLVISNVSDTSNVINATNLSKYLTFIARLRTTSPNLYTAVTVKMSGGLLNGNPSLTFTCTSYGESFLLDNNTITQYVSTPYSNLNAIAPSIPYGLINTSYISQSTPVGSSLFLYCVNFGSNNINMYTINTSTGLLSNNSPSTLTVGPSPRNIVISKDGRYVYATNSVSTNIQMMLLNISTGILSNNTTATIPAGTNPSYMVINPQYQNFLYVTNRGSNNIGCYLIDRTTGLLSPLSPASTSLPVGSAPIGIAIAVGTSNTFMYVADYGNSLIYMFSISQASGNLGALSTPTIAQIAPYFILIHPNGLYCYVSSETTASILVYSINLSTGLLTFVQSAAAGNTVREMAITPSGSFLYALNNLANNIQQYSVNSATGNITSLGTVALTNPTSIKMSPDGLYVYVSSGTSNNVTVYGINQTTGLLTVAGSIASGSNAFSIGIL